MVEYSAFKCDSGVQSMQRQKISILLTKYKKLRLTLRINSKGNIACRLKHQAMHHGLDQVN
jgi:hypothetical protein